MKNLNSLILRKGETTESGDFHVSENGPEGLRYVVSLYRGDGTNRTYGTSIVLAHFNALDDVIFFLWALYTGRASAGIFDLNHLPKGKVQFPDSVLNHEFQNIDDRFHLEDELPARNKIPSAGWQERALGRGTAREYQILRDAIDEGGAS